MKVDNVNLKDLLEGSRQFVVPRFQRTYSWEKSHWEDLWNDLEELYNDSNGREHFMGVIVTMPVQMQPHGVSKFLLIDGQQRLTTIFLILACIRDRVEEQGQLAEKINNLYLHNQYSKEKNRHKLLPTQSDIDAFHGVIDGKGHTESKISQVYHYFEKVLRPREADGEPSIRQQRLLPPSSNLGNGDDGEPVVLDRFLDTMIERLVFVSIVIDKDDNPYRIFHSLNGTGQELTQSDLVRNHIFMHIDDSNQDIAYNEYWLPIQTELDDPKKRDSFMVDFMLKDGEFISKNAVYDSIRHATGNVDNPTEYVQDLLENLAIYSKYYLKLVDPTKESDPRLSALLARLNSLRITTPYPFILNLYHDEDSGRLSKEIMCQALEAIESFLVRRYFCRIHSRGLTHIFLSMYKNVSNQGDIVSETYRYLRSRKFPSDEEFLQNWVTYPVYGTSIQDRSRFVLQSLESHIKQNKEPVDFSAESITREHVMPRMLTDEWRAMLGLQAATTHEKLLNTIGNLTLTGENESMGNKPFHEKRKVFARSSFALNEYFQQCETWDNSAILERARGLGQVALEIWKRPLI